MKRIVLPFLLLGTIVLVPNSFGQAPPPPPAPLIHTPPAASDITKFTPADGSFEAEFPGKPTEKTEPVEGGVVTSYSVNRKGSTSMVAITSPTADKDLTSMHENVFAAIRNGISKRPRTKIVTETELALNGFNGREFEVNYGLEQGIVRIFLVGRKIVEIQTTVTNWHIIGDKTKSDWRKETARFFDSFKILK